MKKLKEVMVQVRSAFNISRNDMPQIDNVNDFIDFLESKDVKVTFESVYIDEIKPTQMHFDIDKVANMTPSSKPIILSQQFFILDGHHRYYRKLMHSEGHDKMNAYIAHIGINTLLKLAYEYLDND